MCNVLKICNLYAIMGWNNPEKLFRNTFPQRPDTTLKQTCLFSPSPAPHIHLSFTPPAVLLSGKGAKAVKIQ